MYFDAANKAASEYRKKLEVLLVGETKAGNLDSAIEVRDELKKLETQSSLKNPVSSKIGLKKMLNGTRWSWGSKQLLFHPDGFVRQQEWENNRLVTRWDAIDRRTVLLIIEKGRPIDRYAILQFSENLDEFKGYAFENAKVIVNAEKRLR